MVITSFGRASWQSHSRSARWGGEFNSEGKGSAMRKFGFFATTALILAGFGAWMASTSQARVAASIVLGPQINAMQMMSTAANLPAEHFVDYSLVYE
jgi:hypothetical protein